MGTFLLDLRVGERLSYGMALALVVVAQQIATGGLVPVSNERLWIDKFIGWSFYWVVVGLVESVFVGYLYFMREDKYAKAKDSPGTPKPLYDGLSKSKFEEAVDTEGEQERMNSSVSQPNINGENKVQSDLNASNDNQGKTGTVDGEAAERNQSKRLTFKLQLQETASKENVGPTMQHQNEAISKYWRWVYTISLRRMDRFFFFLTLISYTIFLLAMFFTVPLWGEKMKDVWIDESSIMPGS